MHLMLHVLRRGAMERVDCLVAMVTSGERLVTQVHWMHGLIICRVLEEAR